MKFRLSGLGFLCCKLYTIHQVCDKQQRGPITITGIYANQIEESIKPLVDIHGRQWLLLVIASSSLACTTDRSIDIDSWMAEMMRACVIYLSLEIGMVSFVPFPEKCESKRIGDRGAC